jgi:hypothetical protein
MTKRIRNGELVFIGIAVLTALILAIGLSRLELRPGEGLPLTKGPTGIATGLGDLGWGDIIVVILRGFLALGLVLLPVYIIVNLLTPQGRKRLIADAITFSLMILSVYLLLKFLDRNKQNIVEKAASTPAEVPPPLGEITTSTYPIPELIAHTPPWVTALIGIGLALLIAGIVTGLFLVLQKQLRTQLNPLEQLGQEAQSAVDSLQGGSNFRDTIIRCYAQMSQILRDERGIERESAMTPREFEQLLKKKGFPDQPVQQLTQLFEEVRYGKKTVGAQGERQAIESLTQIVRFCKNPWRTEQS